MTAKIWEARSWPDNGSFCIGPCFAPCIGILVARRKSDGIFIRDHDGHGFQSISRHDAVLCVNGLCPRDRQTGRAWPHDGNGCGGRCGLVGEAHCHAQAGPVPSPHHHGKLEASGKGSSEQQPQHTTPFL